MPVLEAPPQDAPLPVARHLSDLRIRLLRAGAGWLAAAAAAYVYYPAILGFLIRPPLEKLAYFSPAEPFFAQIKISFAAGFLAAFPWILYQAWAFARPGLHFQERRFLSRAIPASYALFLAGAGLGFFVAAPLGLKFLMGFGGPQLVPTISLGAYLGYTAYLTIGMGILFQLPVVLWVLAGLGWVDPATLAGHRKHMIVGILIAVAIVTPGPDIIGQVLIAVPTYLLYELSLWLMRLKST